MADVLLVAGPLLVTLVAASAGDIAAAHVRGDLDEVSRMASLAGAAGVREMLSAPDPAVVHAGLAAAPAAADAWELLDELADLAGGWDRSVAAPAALAATTIARRLDADAAILHDLADDALESQQVAWAALAARVDRWTDVRVLALEVTSHLAAARAATAEGEAGLGYELANVLGDADPEVRRAGCELVPQPTPAGLLPTIAAAIRDDADPAVAVACGQALCADLAFDPPAAAMAALGDGGAARLRAILGDRRGPPVVPAGALVDAARCLAAHGTREDRAALRVLAERAPKQTRAMIRRVESRKK